MHGPSEVIGPQVGRETQNGGEGVFLIRFCFKASVKFAQWQSNLAIRRIANNTKAICAMKAAIEALMNESCVANEYISVIKEN